MPCPLSDLIEKLVGAVAGQPDREAAVQEVLSAPEPCIVKFPLVHRTGDRKRGNVLERIFVDGHLRPPKRQSEQEVELRLSAAVYFFYGAGCYPEGNVAFVFPPEIAESEGFSEATFSPFDSGGLGTPCHLHCSFHGSTWNDGETRADFLDRHTGYSKDLLRFGEVYLAAHFDDYRDYVRRPQYGNYDERPYHGLTSEDGDRRAWTIEVRNPQSVSLDDLEAILVDRALRRQVSDTYFGFIRLVDGSDGFDRGVASYVEDNHCQAGSLRDGNRERERKSTS